MKKEMISLIYGLESLEEVVDEILDYLNGTIDYFDLRLILSESVSNAFFHGNRGDKSKPIKISVKNEKNEIIFEIEDSGAGAKWLYKEQEISEENILNDNGRGLFLLKSFTDEIKYQNNTLVLKKKKYLAAN